ncbi:polyamine-transporting ATPase 13A3-like isoform X1 [Penaeus japonicus]|uniref:polyamine-transporting ATPase 13A3-like isoform X1 n=2 Tax=Penaeus japonicus TaxID=27405 RepID=UPI001C70F9B8|nr:polyamine-transporting ATPase 13A3-like isoform X1 [Penaeus japonicus]
MRRFSWYAFLTDEVAGMAYDRLGEDASAEGVKLQYHQQVLKLGTDEELTLSGYCRAFCKMFVFYFISLVTLGIPFLLVYWKPEWGVFWKRRRCALMEADMLIIKDLDGQIYVSSVDSEMVEAGFPSKYIISSHLTNGASNGVHNGASDSTHLTQPRHRIIRYFIFQHIKYIWIPDKLSFERLYGCDSNTSISSLLNDFRGYTVQEQMQRQQLFGRNAISVEVKSYFHLLVTEVLNPFYIFQIASIILWSFDNYVLYATCIFLVSCLSVAVSLYETRKQSQSLHDMVEASNTNTATVLRSTIEKTTVEVEVNTVDLVPGDVLVIPATGCLMACDAVLISGNAIVNESMLTGESVPVTKTPVTTSEGNETYSAEKHKRHTLFCGTAVIQTRYYGNAQVLAVVVRTGFSTAKGELVRSILYPRPLDFKFYKDSMKFILFMFGIASLGMSYSIYIYIMHKETILKTVVRTLDIVTIVVPPALPAAMTVGTYYAQSRLKQKGIFCISPPRINVSGKLKLVCFDKTGTLTEDGLEVWGVVEAKGDQLSTPVMDISTLDHTSQLVAGLATCHSLTYVHGELTGDPLDVKMFESTKWELEEPEEDDTQRFDNLIPTLVRPPKCPVHHPSPAPAPVPHSSSSSPPPAPLCPPSSSPPPRSSLSPSPVPPSPPPPSPSVPCTSTPHIESEVTASVCHETTCTSVVPHTAASDGCDSDFVPQGVGLIEQTLEEAAPGSANFDQVTPTVVKPSKREVYIDPPDITHVAETPFQVPYELGIVRQFPFSSSTQRMSVLVRVLGRSYMDLYAKGAPEVIQSLCRPESIPEDLGPILTQYTVQGFRVIALAHRTLETKLSWHAAQRIPRDQVECDLNFVGLLILQNMLKPETAPVIRQLKAANIRTVMVTGDNILTGISVARDCGMVGETDHVLLAKVTAPSPEHPASLTFEPADTPDILVQYSDDVDNKYTCMNMGDGNPRYHLAVTGKAWALLCQYFPDLVPRIVARGTVFARMSPDQKAQLVEELQAIDYVVGMCGDGANDCGALKAAHVGISLSEAEASVAAPFTSHTDNIQCVPQVICEGRCALTTNFSVFKYMALYSIIQFVSVLILYTAYSNLTDPQFLYIDLFIVTVIAVFMGYTGARHELVAKKPLGNLLGAVNMFSVLSQITLVILTQVIAYLYLLQQPWFEPNKPTPGNEEDNTVSWETATIFYVSAFQYLTLCIAYSPGRPFRQPIYTNFWLTVSLVSLTVITLVMLLCPWSWLMQLMKIRYDPENNLMMFRVALLLVIALHFVVSLSTEHFVARSRILKNCFQWITCKREPKNKYKIVLRDMDEDSSWPPIATPIYATLHT